MKIDTTTAGGIYPYRRYVILVAAVLMQMCLGATYSWSVFVGSIKAITGLGQGAVQWPFSVFYIVFPTTTFLSGMLLGRLGLRFCAIAGGILFGGGWLLAGVGEKHYVLTVCGIGLLGGLGSGLGYLVPVAALVQWFPRSKGLVTGISLAGFGGGAALVSQIAGRLINAHSATAFEMFRVLGVSFLLIVTLTGSVMCFPKNPSQMRSHNLSLAGVVRNWRFKILYLTLFVGLMAGFTVNANMTKLYSGSNVEAGVTAVALFALANALGRVVWGFIFDRMKSPMAVTLNLGLQGGLMLAGFWLLRSSVGLGVFAFAAGFNYGGLVVIHASSAARFWGGENVGQVYGYLCSANLPASFAPMLAGFAYDRWGSFQKPILILAVFLLAAAVAFHRRMKASVD